MDIGSQNQLNSEYCELDRGRALLLHLITQSQNTPEALPNSEFVSDLINDLLQNLQSHFAREERLLASISHQSLESQRSAHSDLLEQLSEICLGLVQGDREATHKLHIFLTSELQKHLSFEAGNHLAHY